MNKLAGGDEVRKWAERITAAWRQSVNGILTAGQLLAQAKANLPHGAFLGMIEAELPFHPRTAQKLMAIAADERLTDAAHVPLLPPHWGTLYELTKLDDSQFAAAVGTKTIRPDMERREVAQKVKATKRADRERELGEKQKALPKQRYGVIVADPEWRFESWSCQTGMDRAADNHYPTSCTEVIAARDVPSIAADDCALFMWAIVPMLAEAFCVLDAWGFARFDRDAATGLLTIDKSAGRYVSSATWTKYKPGAGIGMGHWFRVDHEILLVATRGNVPAPAQGNQARSVFDIPASRVHSEKPELALEIVESYFPTLPKIELNRRGPARPGWAAWGNEAQQITESATGPNSYAAPAHVPVIPAMHVAAGSPPSHDDDPLDIPNFLRIGHPDCWRSAKL